MRYLLIVCFLFTGCSAKVYEYIRFEVSTNEKGQEVIRRENSEMTIDRLNYIIDKGCGDIKEHNGYTERTDSIRNFVAGAGRDVLEPDE